VLAVEEHGSRFTGSITGNRHRGAGLARGWVVMVFSLKATRSAAAIAAERRVSRTVLSRRLRPGRYRSPAPVRPVVNGIPHLTRRAARAGITAGALARPHKTSRIRERCRG
jgi:hypothetical protein